MKSAEATELKEAAVAEGRRTQRCGSPSFRTCVKLILSMCFVWRIIVSTTTTGTGTDCVVESLVDVSRRK